jgi:hypothetical protein
MLSRRVFIAGTAAVLGLAIPLHPLVQATEIVE